MVPPGSTGLPNTGAISAFTTASQPVQLTAGPGGDLFYVSIGGTIHRISYSTNTAPQAVVRATPAAGAAPLAVSFDGRSSNDPDGDAITYAWDLDDDGTYDDGSGSTAAWTYASEGDHTARLRVTDSRGLSGTASVQVIAGGEPTAVIDAPAAGSTRAVGDRVTFSATGPTPRMGRCRRRRWSGPSCSTTAPRPPRATSTASAPGRGPAAPRSPSRTTSRPRTSRLILTATDRAGVKDTAAVRLDIRTVAITVASDPSGVSIAVGSGTVETPATLTVFVGSRISLGAPGGATVGGRSYVFDRWSDGGAAGHDVTAPATATTFRAFYSPK